MKMKQQRGRRPLIPDSLREGRGFEQPTPDTEEATPSAQGWFSMSDDRVAAAIAAAVFGLFMAVLVVGLVALES